MKISKQNLKACLDAKETEASCLHLALNDVLNDQVTWFKRGTQRLGISRATGASGGIVIHREVERGNPSLNYTTGAYYWEAWFPQIRDDYGTTMQDIRLCALDAHDWILKQQRTADLTPIL